MSTNEACWLPCKKAYPYTVEPAPMPEIGEKQVLVRVRTVAINPADWVSEMNEEFQTSSIPDFTNVDFTVAEPRPSIYEPPKKIKLCYAQELTSWSNGF